MRHSTQRNPLWVHSADKITLLLLIRCEASRRARSRLLGVNSPTCLQILEAAGGDRQRGGVQLKPPLGPGSLLTGPSTIMADLLLTWLGCCPWRLSHHLVLSVKGVGEEIQPGCVTPGIEQCRDGGGYACPGPSAHLFYKEISFQEGLPDPGRDGNVVSDLNPSFALAPSSEYRPQFFK